MPRPGINWSDPAFWREMYSLRATGRPGLPSRPMETEEQRRTGCKTFCRKLWMDGFLWPRVTWMVDILELKSSSKIIIIGGAWGWSQEIIEQLIPGIQVATVDTSPLVHLTKDQDEAAWIEADVPAIYPGRAAFVAKLHDGGPRSRRPILDQDVGIAQGRNAAKSAIGLTGNNKPDFVISEDVVDSLEDAEVITLDADMRKIGPTVHFIAGQTSDPRFNLKTPTEWKALLPEATILWWHGARLARRKLV